MKGRLCGNTAIAGLLAACVGVGGCGDDPTMVTPPAPPPSGRVVKANPSLATDLQEIFNRKGCSFSSCHGVAASAGLELGTPAVAFASLVGVTATREPIIRVVPNDADNSYLIIKLEGRQAEGAQMPLGGTALDTIDLNNIKNWINTGALSN